MFKRILEYFGYEKRSLPYKVTPDHFSVSSLLENAAGTELTEDSVVGWSAIWRGLQLIGNAVGSMPFTIIEEDKDGNVNQLRNHALWSMIHIEPHPLYSTFDFLQAVMFQALLRGNAVIVIDRIGRQLGVNRPNTLRLVHWDAVVDIRETEDGRLLYKITGYQQPIEHTDIIHIKGVSKDGICGLDTFLWNKETFGLSIASNKTTGEYYKNGTHSDGFLTTEQMIDPEKRQTLQKAWNANVNSGSTPFLTGGVKWEKIGVDPKDVQLLESRQFNVYEAARVLGISPHLLFAMDRANFSNVETLSLEFAKYTLRFWVEKIEQEFNRKIFRKSERGRVKVNLNMDAFLRGDTDARAKYLQTLLDRGVLNIDEARKIEGWNALPDGMGKHHFVPMNYNTIEQALKEEEKEDMANQVTDIQPEETAQNERI